MKNFNLKFLSIVEIPGGKNEAKSYSAVVQLNQLVDLHKKFNGKIYDVNVRGALTGKGKRYSKYEKNPVHSGISQTLNNISNGFDDPISFYNKNGGALLICDTIKKIGDNEYEFSLSTPYHGFGNGQQTISISSFVNKKIQIPEDTYVQLQIMSGYNEKDCYKACRSHNTSNKISAKDAISNDWKEKADELNELGYILHYKSEEIVPKGSNVINICESNYYNIMNSYFNETPWLNSTAAVDGFDNGFIDTINTVDMIKLFHISKDLDIWFENNYKLYHDDKFYDTARPGYAKNLAILVYKRYFDKYHELTGDDSNGFFKFFMDIVWKIPKEIGRKIDSQFYNSHLNCKVIIDNLEKDLQSMENKILKEKLRKNSVEKQYV